MQGQIVFGDRKNVGRSEDQSSQPQPSEHPKPSQDTPEGAIAQTDSAYVPKSQAEAEDIGEKQAIRDSEKTQEKSKQKLDDLVNNSHKVVMRVKNVFPFVLFPDELIIDANKVDIIYNQFFSTAQVRTVLVKDIADVTVETALFFATLRIIDKSKEEYAISFLKIDDAVKARRILQGILLSITAGIDLTSIDKEEIQTKVEEIGRARDRI